MRPNKVPPTKGPGDLEKVFDDSTLSEIEDDDPLGAADKLESPKVEPPSASPDKNDKQYFQCEICPAAYPNLWSLQRHEFLHDILYEEYKCPGTAERTCDLYCHTTRELFIHQSYAHNVWKCTKCKRTSPTRDELHAPAQVSDSGVIVYYLVLIKPLYAGRNRS